VLLNRYGWTAGDLFHVVCRPVIAALAGSRAMVAMCCSM
jgi:hypothetical protein